MFSTKIIEMNESNKDIEIKRLHILLKKKENEIEEIKKKLQDITDKEQSECTHDFEIICEMYDRYKVCRKCQIYI
jgi:histidyl-tRNA synthetase